MFHTSDRIPGYPFQYPLPGYPLDTRPGSLGGIQYPFRYVVNCEISESSALIYRVRLLKVTHFDLPCLITVFYTRLSLPP